MYLVGVQLGNYLFFGNHTHKMSLKKWASIRVWIFALVFWLNSNCSSHLVSYFWFSLYGVDDSHFVSTLQAINFVSRRACRKTFTAHGTNYPNAFLISLFLFLVSLFSLDGREVIISMVIRITLKLTENFCSATWPMLLM